MDAVSGRRLPWIGAALVTRCNQITTITIPVLEICSRLELRQSVPLASFDSRRMDRESFDLDLSLWVVCRCPIPWDEKKGTRRAHSAHTVYPGTRDSPCVVRQGLLFARAKRPSDWSQTTQICFACGCLTLVNRINDPAFWVGLQRGRRTDSGESRSRSTMIRHFSSAGANSETQSGTAESNPVGNGRA